MFQLYEVAYQAYYNAKRDFNADQAWLHFAGASVCIEFCINLNFKIYCFI